MQNPSQNAEPHTVLKMCSQMLGKGKKPAWITASQTRTSPLFLSLHPEGRARPIFPAFPLVILSLFFFCACRGQLTDPGPMATTFYNLAHATFPVSLPPPPCNTPPPSRAGLPTHCLPSQRPVPPPHLCSRQAAPRCGMASLFLWSLDSPSSFRTRFWGPVKTSLTAAP